MLFFVLCAVAFGNPVEKLFSDWSKEHGKLYSSSGEAIRRYEIFKTNLAWINKANTELKYMTVGLNEFADMELEEFEATYLDNSYVHDDAEYAAELNRSGVELQDNNNIRVGGQCATPVRNQGSCGSCWAFSAGVVLEALLCLPAESGKENDHGWVSTQELVDCTCNGCNGGLKKTGLEYWKSKGVCYEAEYAYTAKKGSCQSSKCKHPSHKGVTLAKDQDGGITAALASNFVGISIDAGGLDFMFYKSGTYGIDRLNCNKHSVNHAVAAVASVAGYDGTPNSNYHVKNSWGTSWGNKGFFDMPAGVNCLNVQKRQGLYAY